MTVSQWSSTEERYSAIRKLGLDTVIWEKYRLTFEEDVFFMLKGVGDFIGVNAPCLFIYDPLCENGRKGYLFDVKHPREVADWVDKNERNLFDYSYLVTSQVTSTSNGFVGTVFSDGKGSMVCETLHVPGVSNHRALSQPSEDISDEVDYFTVEDFSLLSAGGKFLRYKDIRSIMRLYERLEGEFEFVKGVQAGKVGMYTMGYEKTPFQTSLHERLSLNPKGCLTALLFREGR